MKREEALRIIKECKEKGFKHTFYTLNEYHTALDIAIKALEQELCEDAISRWAVLDIIRFEDKWLLDAKGHTTDTEITFSGMKSKISDLPPVNPQQKTGYWIVEAGDRETGYGGCTMCSECSGEGNTEMDYCPHCGARMFEPQERSGEE